MTNPPFWRTAWFLAVLLSIGAALFAVGVAIERHTGDHHTEASATAVTVHTEVSENGAEGGTEAASTSTAHTGGATASTAPTEGTSTESSQRAETSEKIFGINAESNGTLAVAVTLTAGLAVLVLTRPRRPVFLVVAVFTVTFAAFDIVEVIHQIHTSHAGVAAIAIVLALVHAVAARLAIQRHDPVAGAAAFGH